MRTRLFIWMYLKELLARRQVERGDYVQVTGILAVDSGQNQTSRVDIRIAVSDLERIDRPEQYKREERATLEYLKSLRPAISQFQFPGIGSIKISLVHPASEQSRVHDDFQLQLSPVRDLYELELIRVPMNNAEEIAAGIRRATGNVLVLVRGGGDPVDFEVFDQKPVIEAWAGKNAFKALGLGHEGTGGTLLDFISDYVGSTPTAVGGFLAHRMLNMDQRRQKFEALARRCEAVDADNRRLNIELQGAASAARRERKQQLIVAAFFVAIFFALGVMVGYRLAH